LPLPWSSLSRFLSAFSGLFTPFWEALLRRLEQIASRKRENRKVIRLSYKGASEVRTHSTIFIFIMTIPFHRYVCQRQKTKETKKICPSLHCWMKYNESIPNFMLVPSCFGEVNHSNLPAIRSHIDVLPCIRDIPLILGTREMYEQNMSIFFGIE
jgi:hypothetical protein